MSLSSKINWVLCGYLLGATLIIGLILRVWGINFYWGHPDESQYLLGALQMLALWDFNPHDFRNPPFLNYMHMALMVIYYSILKIFGIVSSPLEFKKLTSSDPTYIFVIARCLSAVLGTCTLFLLYKIGKKLFNREVGLIAAALLCVSFLHVRDSHYAVNDIPATFFMILAFYFMSKIIQGGSLKDYIWSGFFTGLGIATKYNMGIVIAPFIVAHFFSPERKGHTPLLIGLACVGGGLLVGCPWALLDTRVFIDGFLRQFQNVAQPWFGGPTANPHLLYGATLLWGYGYLPVLWLIPGIISLFREKNKLCFLLAFPLIYYAAMGFSKLFFVRYAIPGVPFLCIISAVGLIALAQWISSRHQQALALLFLVITAFQGAYFSIVHNNLLMATDTRILARQWIMKHLPPGSFLLIQWYGPDLINYATGAKLNDYRITNLPRKLSPKNLEDYKTQGINYIIDSDFISKRYYISPEKYSSEIQFFKYLNDNVNKIMTFRPAETDVPFYIDEIYSPFWNLFLIDRPGPELSIYQLQ